MTTLTEGGARGPAAVSVPLLRSTVRHSGPRCTALALVSMAATGANLLLPVALGRALDLLLAGDPDGSAWVLRCAALVLAAAVLDAVETVLGGTTNARAAAWLRHRLVRHLLAVGPRAGSRFGPGDLVARLVGNAAQAGTAPATGAALVAALAGPLGAVVALALIDPRLAAVFLVGAPPLALVLRALARDSSDCAARYQRAQGRIAGGLAEAVAGHRTIAAAGTADRTISRVLRPLPELSRQGTACGTSRVAPPPARPPWPRSCSSPSWPVPGSCSPDSTCPWASCWPRPATPCWPRASASWSGSSRAWSARGRRPGAWTRYGASPRPSTGRARCRPAGRGGWSCAP